MSTDELLGRLLGEFEQRLNVGDLPDPVTDEYCQKYPDFADEIRETFGAAKLLHSAAKYEIEAAANDATRTLPIFDGYQIEEIIRDGGMAQVYRARDLNLPRFVAIKEPNLPKSGKKRNDACQCFRHEAQIAEKVSNDLRNHTKGLRICRIHAFVDAEEPSRTPFLVMEWFLNGSLKQDLERKKTYTPRAAAKLVQQLAEMLEILRTFSIVHCDLKPGNILLDKDVDPALSDFGFAFSVERRAEWKWGGTPQYMSPEQYHKKVDQIDHRSDLYSLGVILYELLTGCRPTLHTVPSRGFLQGLDERLEKIVRRALSPLPNDRYQTAKMFAKDLADWLENTDPGRPVGTKVRLDDLPTASTQLVGRESEEQLLKSAWANPKTKIVTVVADGGSGKSALVSHWVAQMAVDSFRGATHVYGVSFYRQGTKSQISADLFIHNALDWFGDPTPTKGAPEAKGERLAELIACYRTLLILDGLEVFQDAEGRIKDRALASFLSSALVNARHALCVITSRRQITKLAAYEGAKEPEESAALLIRLKPLSEEAGTLLLQSFEVHGSPEELRQACREFSGHALSLTLLGTFLRRYCKGDVRKRHWVNLVKGNGKDVDHARRLMASHEEGLRGKRALALLYVLGLFDRPADSRSIDALCDRVIPGLTDGLVGVPSEVWSEMLWQLREDRLIAAENPTQPDVLDAHPIVRSYFGERLQKKWTWWSVRSWVRAISGRPSAAWQSGHSRLYEHLRDLYISCPALAKKEPDTPEEMKVLYAALFHACQAGWHERALEEVYYPRIQRGGTGYSTRVLSLFGEDRDALQPFCDSDSCLAPEWRALLMGMVGSRWRADGEMREAIRAIEGSFKLEQELGQQMWAAYQARHLAEIYLALGDLRAALFYAQQGVVLADQSQNSGVPIWVPKCDLDEDVDDHDRIQYERFAERAVQGTVLHYLGERNEAARLFREAEEILKNDAQYPGLDILYSLWGYRYCEFLLDGGDYNEVQRRGHEMQRLRLKGLTKQDPEKGLGLVSIGLEYLILGQAGLVQMQLSRPVNTADVQAHLDTAVNELVRAGRKDFIPLGFLARSTFWRLREKLDLAKEDLQKMREISKHGNMLLHLAEYDLESARWHLAAGDRSQAGTSLLQAKLAIENIRYFRRLPEIERLEKELGISQ